MESKALLEKILSLEEKATDFGFAWENPQQIMAQIQSECLEVSEHLAHSTEQNLHALQEEIGDLLHAVFSLCVYCKFSPSETLQQTLYKFERRLNAVQTIACEKGYDDLKGSTFEVLMSIWNEAKKRVG